MKLGFAAITVTLLTLMPESQARYIGDSVSETQVVICGIEQSPCVLLMPDVVGTYTLDQTGEGNFLLEGEFTWSNSADQQVLDMVSGLELYFLLLSDKKVVHEVKLPVSGKANKQVQFTHAFESVEKFDSTTFIEYEVQGPK